MNIRSRRFDSRERESLALLSALSIIFSVCNLFAAKPVVHVAATQSTISDPKVGLEVGLVDSAMHSSLEFPKDYEMTPYEEGLKSFCSDQTNAHYSECSDLVHPQAKIILREIAKKQAEKKPGEKNQYKKNRNEKAVKNGIDLRSAGEICPQYPCSHGR